MDQAVAIARLPEADPAVTLPDYQTGGAAGMDVRANFPPADRDAGLVLAPGARGLVPAGFRVAIPDGYELQVRPRSGLALKQGVFLINAPGTIDSDYRGPVGILIGNFGDAPVAVTHGMRIAQLVLAPVTRCRWQEAASLDETARGSGGFGSTGV
ncbi:dUTP diphosphatase [Rhodobacteraceae bacterium KN286]|uniref:Deoxyuridine 5'-triphosphate nucleotidohydrolase n=2 Tax=Oceanomicrobium pacificus TaxID=2692916 RepID=A0A6B0TJB2_9RHOB|nr:dUTP diphosphatase [Oceanomicrobium pacificus]